MLSPEIVCEAEALEIELAANLLFAAELPVIELLEFLTLMEMLAALAADRWRFMPA